MPQANMQMCIQANTPKHIHSTMDLSKALNGINKTFGMMQVKSRHDTTLTLYGQSKAVWIFAISQLKNGIVQMLAQLKNGLIWQT